jgi:hypothetical protein
MSTNKKNQKKPENNRKKDELRIGRYTTLNFGIRKALNILKDEGHVVILAGRRYYPLMHDIIHEVQEESDNKLEEASIHEKKQGDRGVMRGVTYILSDKNREAVTKSDKK